jgi:ubiquinone/menaquinone biosynthesis C-methylase UbiE
MPTVAWLYDLLMKPIGWLGLDRLRRRLVHSARGRTLEIGVGTGLNLDLYERDAAPLVALDVDRGGLLRAHPRLPRAWLVQASVEALPFRDGAFSTVVSCLVFCSVPNPAAGLAEVHRVLDGSGELMMLEHVRPSERFLGWLADHLTPMWSRLAGGCQLNRRTAEALEPAGFRPATLGRHLRGAVVELRAHR